MIKQLRLELMRLYYNDHASGNSKQLDDMELFFDALKILDNYSPSDAILILKDISQKNEPSKNDSKTTAIKNEGITTKTFKNADFEAVTYESVTIKQIEAFETNEALTKAMAIQLANNIGISKKSYKSRKDVFEDIYRMINNRDTMNATKNALVNNATDEQNK